VRAALALLLLSSAGPGASAAERLQLDVVPAWQGWSRPERTTELELRVAGRGEVAIVVTAAARRIETTVALDADRPARFRMTVPSAPSITVRATGPEGSDAETVVALSVAESPLLAWLSPAAPPEDPPTGFRRVAFDSSALPTQGAAYASIDALVIDAQLLTTLPDEQLTALLDYVARCGRTVLLGGSPDAQQLLGAAAGCGARNVGFAESAFDAPEVLRTVLRQDVRPLPDTTALARLDDPDLAHWHHAITVLAGSAALLLLAAVFAPSLVANVTVAALATIVAAWLVQSRPAGSQLAVWAEAGPGERVARYRAVHVATLGRRSEASVATFAQLAAPAPCRDTPDSTWQWSVDERRLAAVSVPARLFGRVATCYSGHFPVARIATRVDDPRGEVSLHNAGPARWPAGVVSWSGRLQEMPVVDPGQDWHGNGATVVAARTPAERLALTRTAAGSAAVLWPLDLALVKSAPPASQAWLLVTALEPAPEGTP